MFKRIGCIGCLLTVIVLSLPLLIGLLLPDSDVDTVVVTSAPAVAPEPTATPVLPPTTEPAATSAPLPFPGVYPYTDSPATTMPAATLAPTPLPTATPAPALVPIPTATSAPTLTATLEPTAIPAPTLIPTPRPTLTPRHPRQPQCPCCYSQHHPKRASPEQGVPDVLGGPSRSVSSVAH